MPYRYALLLLLTLSVVLFVAVIAKSDCKEASWGNTTELKSRTRAEIIMLLGEPHVRGAPIKSDRWFLRRGLYVCELSIAYDEKKYFEYYNRTNKILPDDGVTPSHVNVYRKSLYKSLQLFRDRGFSLSREPD